jgi:hypothetical protein
MKVFAVCAFRRFQRKEAIKDADLVRVIQAMSAGLIDAPLGSYLFKQRLARAGGGKSGGYRVILMYRKETRSVFLYGFPKKDKDTLTPLEVTAYRNLAAIFERATEADMADFCARSEATEIAYDDA